MFRVCALLRQSQVSGGPLVGLSKYSQGGKAIKPSISSAAIDTVALEEKLDSLLAREMSKQDAFTPPLKREWVAAPMSRFSTSVSRRDWFRMLSFNMMTNQWGDARTTPVANPRVRMPAFMRGAGAAEGFVDYDPDKDPHAPPFLSDEFRRTYLVDHLKHWDPDLVCLNEVNRSFFRECMWGYVRYLGYGTLYQSSRGARVKALRPGDDPAHPRHAGKIPETEDIGNVVLFHKGRFVPMMMPGRDLGNHFHFCHLVSMRDKVTNLNILIACVQLTAGSGPEAAHVRLQEAQQTLTLIDAATRNDSDRAHTSCTICGDLNNESDEEPCVELFRERFFSTYDLVGGPRWTTWHYAGEPSSAYKRYYEANKKEFVRANAQNNAAKELHRFIQPDGKYHGRSSHVRLLREVVTPTERRATGLSADTAAATPPAAAAETDEGGPAAAEKKDQLALVKEHMKEKGIVCRTQDFIFYDPKTLALHKVLDVPEDSEVDMEELFPSKKLPSHHLPLVIDVSFNDPHPDVAAHSLKP